MGSVCMCKLSLKVVFNFFCIYLNCLLQPFSVTQTRYVCSEMPTRTLDMLNTWMFGSTQKCLYTNTYILTLILPLLLLFSAFLIFSSGLSFLSFFLLSTVFWRVIIILLWKRKVLIYNMRPVYTLLYLGFNFKMLLMLKYDLICKHYYYQYYLDIQLTREYLSSIERG